MRIFIALFHIFYLLYIVGLILGTLAIMVIGAIAAVTYFIDGSAHWLIVDGVRQWAAAVVITIAVWFVTLTIMDEI